MWWECEEGTAALKESRMRKTDRNLHIYIYEHLRAKGLQIVLLDSYKMIVGGTDNPFLL